MFNPPIMSGANLFITIAVMLIAAVVAVMAIDVYKNTFQENKPSKDQQEDEDKLAHN